MRNRKHFTIHVGIGLYHSQVSIRFPVCKGKLGSLGEKVQVSFTVHISIIQLRQKTAQFMPSYVQVCGQKTVKTPQMLIFCRRQRAALGMSSRSASAEQGGRKAGTTLCPPCQPRCTEELANSRFFVPEASDQREGLLVVKQISPSRGAVAGREKSWSSTPHGFRGMAGAKVMRRTNLPSGKILPAHTVGFFSPQAVNAMYKHIPGF